MLRPEAPRQAEVKYEIKYTDTKVLTVTVQTFISLHHLLSEQMTLKVHDHSVYACAAIALSRCSYRDR